jgi:hypothetical protein
LRGVPIREGIDVARRTIQVLTDDLDGGEAEETVKFGLDGVQYEIDLSSGNAAKIRDVLSPYVGAGRKIGRGGVVPGGRAAAARVRDRCGSSRATRSSPER